MSYTRATGSVCCPFFKGHSAHEIRCEGIVDNSYLSLMFQKECDMRLQERIFCEGRYKNCEVCRMLLRDKYEED